MYNNIGLKTVRGSGTNGYIQTNLAALPANWKRFRGRRRAFETEEPDKKPKLYKPSQDLIDHNKKRAVEVKVFEYREKLEEQDFEEENIEEKVAAYRKYMLEKMAAGEFDEEAQYCGHNASRRGNELTRAEEATEQKKKNKKMFDALKISGDHVHGKAFDQDLAVKEKNERLAKMEGEMSTEQRIAFREQNYLDRLEGREPQNEPLHRPGPSDGGQAQSERVPNDWRYGRSGYRDRDRGGGGGGYRSKRQFSRSNSPEGRSPPRKRPRSRSPVRDRRRPRRRSRSRSRGEKPSKSEVSSKKIERWKAESDDDGPVADGYKDKSKKKRKKDKEKKKKKKKRKASAGGEADQDASDPPPEVAEKRKKKRKKKKQKEAEKEEGEVEDLGGEASA